MKKTVIIVLIYFFTAAVYALGPALAPVIILPTPVPSAPFNTRSIPAQSILVIMHRLSGIPESGIFPNMTLPFTGEPDINEVYNNVIIRLFKVKGYSGPLFLLQFKNFAKPDMWEYTNLAMIDQNYNLLGYLRFRHIPGGEINIDCINEPAGMSDKLIVTQLSSVPDDPYPGRYLEFFEGFLGEKNIPEFRSVFTAILKQRKKTDKTAYLDEYSQVFFDDKNDGSGLMPAKLHSDTFKWRKKRNKLIQDGAYSSESGIIRAMDGHYNFKEEEKIVMQTKVFPLYFIPSKPGRPPGPADMEEMFSDFHNITGTSGVSAGEFNKGYFTRIKVASFTTVKDLFGGTSAYLAAVKFDGTCDGCQSFVIYLLNDRLDVLDSIPISYHNAGPVEFDMPDLACNNYLFIKIMVTDIPAGGPLETTAALYKMSDDFFLDRFFTTKLSYTVNHDTASVNLNCIEKYDGKLSFGPCVFMGAREMTISRDITTLKTDTANPGIIRNRRSVETWQYNGKEYGLKSKTEMLLTDDEVKEKAGQ